ncbi:Putative phage protein [Candidatus Glomeribacter gigasporarum BEG34]|uniref:Putative phage protein n=1 Tax=Candidatus Glomeribacter gigasporarum BEG34 TaxID=1070319 RepID=G2JBZ7_9BURK|nr:hypothetical protein [Candidatus Glomeribacter gigasporarum]CCD30303.1 Putative phage protein [Candidatus Glomeribacter gigasporarum BEG34]
MDALTLQQKIYSGYAKAAQRLGLETQVFRPTQADDPFTHPVLTLKACFNASRTTGAAPRLGQSTWQGRFDGRQTQAGDYLWREDGAIWFIAAQALHADIACIHCDARVRIQRAQKTQTKGAVGYEGVSETPQTVLGAKAAWPASLLFGGRGQQGANLPTSEIDAGDIALLPVSVPIIIQPADGLIDDLGRHYRVRAAEKTEMGWRLQVYEAHP